jgi:hypothetical protein
MSTNRLVASSQDFCPASGARESVFTHRSGTWLTPGISGIFFRISRLKRGHGGVRKSDNFPQPIAFQ